MFRRILAASAIAGALVLGTAATASAEATPAAPAPQWIAVSYFGTQTYCTQAATTAQQLGWLTAGQWRCDSGWLMVQMPPAA